MPIHQIYCTHCTHGSSALERREGELAARMLGYSARAGSPLGQDLRRYYRQIERHIYYYLPRDTPAEEKLRLSAATAPRRLIYVPSTGGLQLLAQICYRQVDSEGRPGSYFAHALFRDEKDGQTPWSPLDCLRLWSAAGWVDEDSPAFSFVLPTLFSLDEMLQGRRPAIDDGVLESFLKTPSEGAFDDPGRVIPERWRQKSAAERAAVFADVFRGLLELLGEDERRRESLLLVAEPSVAALWFYGMIRLLPPGPIRQAISFSTFEPNTDRLGTTLAAVEFYDPARMELRSGLQRGRGIVANTFSDRRERPSPAARPHRHEAPYAESALRRLLDEGFEAIDGRLADLHSVGAARVGDLDELAGVDRLARHLLGQEGASGGQSTAEQAGGSESLPSSPLPKWPSSPAALRYLSRVLSRELARAAEVPARLCAVVGQPVHLPVLELLAADLATPAVRVAVEHLLDTLPDEKIAALLEIGAVSDEAKTGVLVRYVTAQADLPPGCEFLWEECRAGDKGRATSTAGGRRLADRGPAVSPPPAATIPPSSGRPPLLEQLLALLDHQTLLRLYANVAERHGDALVVALCRTCRANHENWAPLSLVVEALHEPSLLALYRSFGTAFFKEYPQAERAMAGKLRQILCSLPQRPQQFSPRLDVVLSGEHLLADDRDRRTAAAWASCRRAILRIGELEGQKSGLLQRRPLDRIENAVQQMAEAVAEALPPQAFEDDRSGGGKQKTLRQIGRPLLGGRPLLPPVNWQNRALWQKVAWYFERGVWPRAALTKLRTQSTSLRLAWLALGGAVLVGALIAAVVLVNARRDATQVSPRPEASGAPRPLADGRSPPATTAGAAGEDTAAAEREKLAREAERLRIGREKAAEAAQRDTEAELQEKLQQQARQEAERLAAEREAAALAARETAARLEREGMPPTTVGPAVQPTGRATREAWIAWAERFAAERDGAWFCEEPCDGGRLGIPAERLRVDSDPPTLYLGEGRLDFRQTHYLFGGGFEHQPPTTRQEIPELANELGLKSVFVETRLADSGAAIAVVGVPRKLPAEAAAERKAELERLRQQSRMLTAHLQTYSGRTTPQDKKDEAFGVLRELLEITIPPVPRKPKRSDEQFHERPEAYEVAVREYERKLAARERALESVVPKARETIPILLERIKQLESDSRPLEERVAKESAEALAALAAGSRRLTAIVYQDATGLGPKAAEPSARQAEMTARAEEREAEARDDKRNSAAGADRRRPDEMHPPSTFPPPPSEAPSAEKTVIHIESKPAVGLNPPAVAQIRVLVVGPQGKPLPSSLKDQFVFGLEVMGQVAEGSLKAKRLPDLDVVETTDVLQGTSAVKFRFQFFRRSGNPFDSRHPLVAETPWSDLAIEPRLQYTIKLELGEDQIKLLRSTLEKR